jgi:hypothetical protein
MPYEWYKRIPETMTLREVRFQVTVPGRRTETLIVVTSLIDPVAYPKEDIAELYGYRWNAEICQPYCLQCHNFYEVTVRGFGVLNSAA